MEAEKGWRDAYVRETRWLFDGHSYCVSWTLTSASPDILSYVNILNMNMFQSTLPDMCINKMQTKHVVMLRVDQLSMQFSTTLRLREIV